MPTGVALALIVALAAPSVAEAGPAPPLAYAGSAHPDTLVAQVRLQVEPLLEDAIRQAQELTGFALDREQVAVRLDDLPQRPGNRARKMSTSYGGEPEVIVFVEPLLRGDFPDADALRRSLVHEFIHVLVRQQMSSREYGDLPKWFREGVPQYLLDQGRDRLLDSLEFYWRNPYAGLGGLLKVHFPEPEIAGYFLLAELDHRSGPQGVRDFVHRALAAGKVEDPPQELWDAAFARGVACLETIILPVAQEYHDCRVLYDRGRPPAGKADLAESCFRDLIETYPGTYAAELSHYWMAMCCYRNQRLEEAERWFAEFARLPRNYGLLDNTAYYRLLILCRGAGRTPAAQQAIGNFLRHFPDSHYRDDVAKLGKGLLTKEVREDQE